MSTGTHVNPVIYVSPNGNDVWSGRLPDANTEGTDGPLRTLGAAQAAVRKIKARLDKPAEIRVELRGGRYELDEPWRFHAEDSGFGRTTNRLAQTWPVIWSAYGGETPVISGGRCIPGPWKQETVNGRTVYTTAPPAELLEDGGFTQLWVNGQRRERPKLPKAGFWQVERGIDTQFTETWGHTHPSDALVFKEGQLSPGWRNLTEVQLHLFGWWIDRHVKIRSIDEASRTAHFDRTAKLRMEWTPGEGVDFIVENVFEALTEPGEWYLDRPAGKLYYLPLPGEEISSAEVIVGRLDLLLEVNGGGVPGGRSGNEDESSQGGGHLRFEGLTFTHCEWQLPMGEAGECQAAIHVPGAIRVRGAQDCVFAGCEVAHVNTYGIEMTDGTIETRLEACRLHDLGAGGVRIWHGCKRNVLTDCEIGPGGLVFAAACGVVIGRATGNRVEHCHIHDFFYSGISVGWNWGYGESDGYGNIIEWNHIHDLGKGRLSDMGGIYLLGHAAGTRLRYNHIHDIECRNYGGWCIYLDEGSTDVLVESNLCYRANRHAFMQHYGGNNTVRNNILAYGGEALLSYAKVEPHLGLVFERNILLGEHGVVLRGRMPDIWTPRHTRFEGNLYWCASEPVSFERQSVCFASQAFPHGFAAEARRFAPLGAVPAVETSTPSESDWNGAGAATRFTDSSGTLSTPEGFADCRFLMHDGDLLIRARMRRPAGHKHIPADILWNREHVEIFLQPFADRPGMVQFGVDSGGEIGTLWHECEAPEGFAVESRVTGTDSGWQCEIRLPLAAIAAKIDTARVPEWRYLVGFVTGAHRGDANYWREMGHDSEGVFADPLFVDPAHGDFRLRPESQALKLGFVPWPYDQAGPRNSRVCHAGKLRSNQGV